MSAEFATFGLAAAGVAGSPAPAGAGHPPRDVLDFIVDGRPLLHRLSESDGDAVCPLASDVPPAIPRAEVRGLLLEAPAPLAGGRRVLYSCSDCGALGCGAVTAVVERDGDAVIWRDFAWQTAEPVDLARDGYPGLGPYRFRAEGYRAALERLLAAPPPEGPDPRRVLLVGARRPLLARLAAALRAVGVGADLSRGARGIPAGSRSYGAVVFGRAVGRRERAAVRERLRTAGAEAVYVSGLAPVVPLLVAQIEEALDRGPGELRRLTALTAGPGQAQVEVASLCRVRLVAYRLDRIRRTRQSTLFDGTLPPGRHRIPLDVRTTRSRRRAYLVARALGQVLVTPVPPGE
ncbi:oxidoreductase [Streptomyces yaizuensis]|uniref:Oxidoreductase n=1 Tax=Streptomyces yaizuensis TaxID=2989713 RepID=A0ABQ5P853_9ACTN|nr:oxidoreductase [Streptomyces sp. YSPA8]GLF98421.1 oxidoreductase [Streptomyces sp. YSPA8]